MSKSINKSDRDAGGVVFLGLPFLVEICAGISRRAGIVGFKMDLGVGSGMAARDCIIVSLQFAPLAFAIYH